MTALEGVGGEFWRRPAGSVPQARPKNKTDIGAFLEVLHSPKNEPAMAHQEECAGLEAVTAILIEHGPAAMASAFGIIMNVARPPWAFAVRSWPCLTGMGTLVAVGSH